MKIVLIGKYKMNEWKEIDHAETKDDMDYLEGEYKLTMGQGWMFKRVIEKDIE